jgi:hypothetical protein
LLVIYNSLLCSNNILVSIANGPLFPLKDYAYHPFG